MNKKNLAESKVDQLRLLIKDPKNAKSDIEKLVKELTVEELVVADHLIKKLLKIDFKIDDIPVVKWLSRKFFTDEYIKFAIKGNYKINNENAIHWAIRNNLRFGNMYAIEWVIVYCSSVDIVKIIEWSLDNNLKIGKESILKWVTEIGINKEYFINYAIINDCKVDDVTALEWMISEKKLSYNKVIKICDKKGIKVDNKDPIKWAKEKNLI